MQRLINNIIALQKTFSLQLQLLSSDYKPFYIDIADLDASDRLIETMGEFAGLFKARNPTFWSRPDVSGRVLEGTFPLNLMYPPSHPSHPTDAKSQPPFLNPAQSTAPEASSTPYTLINVPIDFEHKSNSMKKCGHKDRIGYTEGRRSQHRNRLNRCQNICRLRELVSIPLFMLACPSSLMPLSAGTISCTMACEWRMRHSHTLTHQSPSLTSEFHP